MVGPLCYAAVYNARDGYPQQNCLDYDIALGNSQSVQQLKVKVL